MMCLLLYTHHDLGILSMALLPEEFKIQPSYKGVWLPSPASFKSIPLNIPIKGKHQQYPPKFPWKRKKLDNYLVYYLVSKKDKS